MDDDGNGEVSYGEFCALCEESRRKIGPFMQSSDKLPHHSNPYLVHPDIEQSIGSMSRLKGLSSVKKAKQRPT
jgi:hypothetical protein